MQFNAWYRKGINHMPGRVTRYGDSGCQLPAFKTWLYHILPRFEPPKLKVWLIE
jgi:hypothetical protein